MTGAVDPETPEVAVKWRVDILVLGESNWATNNLRFDDETSALIYARNLYGRWMMAKKMRIVPETTPDREPYVPGSEHPNWTPL